MERNIETLAERVAELLDERRPPRWGDAYMVAAEFGLDPRRVVENAADLGGCKVGASRNSKWMFDLDELARRQRAAEAATPARTPVKAPVLVEVPRPRDDEPGFDDSPRPMAKLDLRGRFKQLNPAFSALVGYSEHQFTRARWPSPHDRHSVADQERQLAALVAGDLSRVHFLSTFWCGNGELRQVHGELALVPGDEPYVLLVAA